MSRGRKKKTDNEFFEESMEFFLQNGESLKSICPDIVDEYNDHSLLKLISITYWVGIFSPIAHKQLKEKFGTNVVYVDTMAGSGVTRTRREGDCFCGSCTGAVLSAHRRGFPFDKVIAIEINRDKARALKARLGHIDPNLDLSMHNEDFCAVGDSIADEITRGCISYVVIDPEGFEGMNWQSIKPLLNCRGDAILTWFEMDAWRMRGRALSNGKGTDTTAERLTELMGSEKWKEVNHRSDLTKILVDRILEETKKEIAQWIDIVDSKGEHYRMILLAGKFRNARSLAMEWKNNMKRRLGSSRGRNIARLLDRKTGRIRDLRDYM